MIKFKILRYATLSLLKTNYTKVITDNYCVVDTETTGLSAHYDEVIEIGILRVRNGQVVDQFSQLIQPKYAIDDYITALTGITNEMLLGMPSITDVQDMVLSFIGNDILAGHKTSFDINFLNAGFCGARIENEYIDTLQFARKLYPGMENYTLSNLTEQLGLSNNTHRALSDCTAAHELYETIKTTMFERNLRIEDLWVRKKGNYSKKIDINSIVPETDEIDEDSFFYNRYVVFTGKLEKMPRKSAMQLVVNLGGKLDQSVTKKTNYLIGFFPGIPARLG